MDKLKAIGNWILKSSADPTKVSLTVKSSIVAVAAYASVASGLFGLPNLTPDAVKDIAESAGLFVGNALLVVSLISGAFGAGRKVFVSVKKALSKDAGENN